MNLTHLIILIVIKNKIVFSHNTKVRESFTFTFFAALRDDLNVPKARARLFELLKRLNEKVRTASFSLCDAQLAMDFLYRADRVLGVLDFDVPIPLGDEISLLIEERDKAREAKDFVRADELRNELEALGVTIEDTPGGSRVRRGG